MSEKDDRSKLDPRAAGKDPELADALAKLSHGLKKGEDPLYYDWRSRKDPRMLRTQPSRSVLLEASRAARAAHRRQVVLRAALISAAALALISLGVLLIWRLAARGAPPSSASQPPGVQFVPTNSTETSTTPTAPAPVVSEAPSARKLPVSSARTAPGGAAKPPSTSVPVGPPEF